MRLLLIAVTVAIALAGCAGDEPGPGPAGPATALTLPPSAAAGSTPTESGAPAPLTAADGEDVAACRDGDCEVLVRSGAEIVLDPSTGVDRVRVPEVEDGRARIVVESGNSTSTISGSSGINRLNRLTIRIVDVVGDTAVIRVESS